MLTDNTMFMVALVYVIVSCAKNMLLLFFSEGNYANKEKIRENLREHRALLSIQSVAARTKCLFCL